MGFTFPLSNLDLVQQFRKIRPRSLSRCACPGMNPIAARHFKFEHDEITINQGRITTRLNWCIFQEILYRISYGASGITEVKIGVTILNCCISQLNGALYLDC